MAQKDAEMKSVRIGPQMISRQRLATVEISDAGNLFYDTIRKKIADLASTRGISEVTYYAMQKIRNEGDAGVFTPELRKIWRESTKYQLEPERDLMRAICAILSRYEQGVPVVENDWRIDYREPTPDDAEPARAIEVLNKQVAAGVGSAVDFILRNDREIVTRDEAEAKIKRNAEDRAMVVELMRELNAPADPADVGKTPQENGREGGEISAQLRGEYDGAGGPAPLPEKM